MSWNNIKPIPLEQIEIPGRIRVERGDIDELADSIRARGLIHPISVMESGDGKYTLLGGMRRLLAARSMDWQEILANVFPLVDAQEALLHEYEENVKRKEFTHSERLAFAEKFDLVEREKARVRQFSGLKHVTKSPENENAIVPDDRPEREAGDRRDIVAKFVGYGSGRQLERVQTIAAKDPALFEKVDAGEISVNQAYSQVIQTQDNQVTEDDSDIAQQSTPFIPDGAVATASSIPDSVKRRDMTPDEWDVRRRTQKQVVPPITPDISLLELFDPTTIMTDGEGVSGADHETLMSNSIYARLYTEYISAHREANMHVAEFYHKCTDYEKRIRAYEENIQALQRRIDEYELLTS